MMRRDALIRVLAVSAVLFGSVCVAQSRAQEDREFDSGSRIAFEPLSRTQVANLVTLGKVWGFLKYHHPAVTSGQHQWDYELFRVLPKVVAARTRTEANTVLTKWVANLGPIAPCDPCAELIESDLHLRPRLEWLHEERTLGSDLSRTLLDVLRHRPRGEQFYVAAAPSVGNPVFDRELSYHDAKAGDAGFQLLALYRFWNIVEWWYPYRDVLGEDWDAVLREFIPRVALAQSREDYQLSLMALIARAHDSHANLWNALEVRPPRGMCRVPVMVRFIGREAVVRGFLADQEGVSSLQVGDVIESIDGQRVSKLLRLWSPYYGASNEMAYLREVSRSMTRGDCGPAEFRVRRDGRSLSVNLQRIADVDSYPRENRHDPPGETFRLLPNRVAYLTLSSVKASHVARFISSVAETDGLIVDIRNYPSEYVALALGSLLVERDTPFARFTRMDLSNPGASRWSEPIVLGPRSPRYPGRVVILVDEMSMSQSEYTAMALRASPRAKVVGSTTTGADGNISRFFLPGGLRATLSGLGVFYPDKTPTQRVGIVPDVVVVPTVDGIRAGRDEVLEAALNLIAGDFKDW
jgi:C-terminal processing protease CtpA/Prc